MPYKCSVYGCTGNYNSGKRVSIFRFPTDPQQKEIFTNRMMRKNFTPTKNARVCELHFDETDIVREASFFDERTGRLLTSRLQVPRLREGAVPKHPSVPNFDIRESNRRGRPSKDPSNPDYVPSVFIPSSKKTKSAKTLSTPADGSASEKKVQVWTSLLNLQPIESEAGSSGLSVPPKPESEKLSTKAADSGVSKKSKPRKKPRSPSPTPDDSVENNMEDPLKLCIVKMEIEDDGYANYEDESFLASLTPSSSQRGHQNTLDISFGSSSSIKTEPNQEIVPDLFKIVPTINESAKSPSNNSQEAVEAFFKNIAETVMQLPPHLIEETKSKVSTLVYEMVIQAINEGCTNIKQHEL